MALPLAAIGQKSSLTLTVTGMDAGSALVMSEAQDGRLLPMDTLYLDAKGTVKDDYAKADLHTSHTTTVSVGASYMGLSLSLSLNPAKLFGRKTDYNFNLNYYSPRINVEATYSQSETLSGDIKYGDGTQYLEEGMMNMRTLNVAAYYSFNYRRFSYPAAFTQSMIQRHSAGSWLAESKILPG